MRDDFLDNERPPDTPDEFAARLRRLAPRGKRAEYPDEFIHAADLVVPRKKKVKKPPKVKGPPKYRGPVLPTVIIEKPRCPQCGGIKLKWYRSERDKPDGSTLSWIRCKNEACQHRFRLLQK